MTDRYPLSREGGGEGGGEKTWPRKIGCQDRFSSLAGSRDVLEQDIFFSSSCRRDSEALYDVRREDKR